VKILTQIRLTTPLTDADVEKLRIGQQVLISGIIYTGRDAAHKRMVDLIKAGKVNELPFDPKGQIIYYVGPSPTKPGKVVGSCGPTTSYRMDPYAPELHKLGLKASIGKGKRSPEVIEAMKKYKAVYFAAIGGAAALIAKSIKSAKVIAYPDLGAEAVHEFVVEDFPVVVVNDTLGGDLYQEGIKIYAVK